MIKRFHAAVLALTLLAAGFLYAQGRQAIKFPTITTAGYADGSGNSDWVVVDSNATLTLQTRKSGTVSGCSIHLQGTTLAREDAPTDSDAFSLSGAQDCTSNLMVHIPNRPVKMIRIHVDSFSGSNSPSVQPLVYR